MHIGRCPFAYFNFVIDIRKFKNLFRIYSEYIYLYQTIISHKSWRLLFDFSDNLINFGNIYDPGIKSIITMS